LLSLAWSWHGELSLTAQHVDALIAQIMANPQSEAENRERAMLLGVSGDPRAISALVRLLAECGHSDEAIAAIRALARLRAVDTQRILLAFAETQKDLGTRISAIRALVELGFQENERVEIAAKKYFQEMFEQFGNRPDQEEVAILQRWKEEATESRLN
jgi:hypothetical protein